MGLSPILFTTMNYYWAKNKWHWATYKNTVQQPLSSTNNHLLSSCSTLCCLQPEVLWYMSLQLAETSFNSISKLSDILLM